MTLFMHILSKGDDVHGIVCVAAETDEDGEVQVRKILARNGVLGEFDVTVMHTDRMWLLTPELKDRLLTGEDILKVLNNPGIC